MTDQTTETTKVAFIGLGKMGLPMAKNLVAAGFDVTGADLSEAARAAFSGAGGKTAATPAEAAAGCHVAITMLPTSAIVADSLLGKGGVAAQLAAGAIVVDMSSSVPSETVALGQTLAKMGIALVDAPVSGGVPRAVSGTLSIMAGGEAVDRAEPYMAAMGNKIFRTGRLGSGHAMKVLNNYVSAAGALAAVEALVIGREFGIDQGTITDILNASTGRNNTTELKLKTFILSGAYNSGFDMALMSKDVTIAADLARTIGLNMSFLEKTAADWAKATAELPKGVDHTEIYRFVDEQSRC